MRTTTRTFLGIATLLTCMLAATGRADAIEPSAAPQDSRLLRYEGLFSSLPLSILPEVDGTITMLGTGGGDSVIVSLRPDGSVVQARELSWKNGQRIRQAMSLFRSSDGYAMLAFGVDKSSGATFAVVVRFNLHWEPISAVDVDIVDLYRVNGADLLSDGTFVIAADLAERGSVLVALDSSDRLKWIRKIDFAGGENFTAIRAARKGGFFLGGNANDAAWLVRMTADGDVEWNTSVVVGDGSRVRALREAKDGSLLVTGKIIDIESDVWAASLDPRGVVRWARRLRLPGGESAVDIAEDRHGRILITGQKKAPGERDLDGWLIAMTVDGRLLGQMDFGGPENDGDQSRMALDRSGVLWVALNGGRAGLGVMRLTESGALAGCDELAPTAARFVAVEPFLPDATYRVETIGVEISKTTPPVVRERALEGTIACPIEVHGGPGQPADEKAAAEIHEHEEAEIIRDVARDFVARRFDRLESRAAELRRTRARLAEWSYQIYFFYEGLLPRSASFWGMDRDEYFRTIAEWRRQYPESVTPVIVEAGAWNDLAWEARGGGYSVTVDEREAWSFAELSRRAVDVIHSWKGDRSDPQFYQLWLWIAIATGSDAEWPILEAGARVDPAYFPLYSRMVFGSLPRWGGSPEEVKRVVEFAVRQSRDEIGEGIYARLADFVRDDEREEYERYGFEWPRIRQGFRDLLKHFPESRLNWHRFASFACYYKDRETAKELFSRPELRPTRDLLAQWEAPNTWLFCHDWAMVELNPPVARVEAEKEIEAPAPTGPKDRAEGRWIEDLPANWPRLVYPFEVTLADGATHDLTGFFVRVDGEIKFVSSGQFLSELQLATFDPRTMTEPTGVAGLLELNLKKGIVGSPDGGEPIWSVKSVMPGAGAFVYGVVFGGRATTDVNLDVLEVRPTPLGAGEAVFVVTCEKRKDGCTQRVWRGQLSGGGRGGGSRFRRVQIRPMAQVPGDVRGALVLDTEGRIAGIVTLPPMTDQIYLDADEIGLVLNMK